MNLNEYQLSYKTFDFNFKCTQFQNILWKNILLPKPPSETVKAVTYLCKNFKGDMVYIGGKGLGHYLYHCASLSMRKIRLNLSFQLFTFKTTSQIYLQQLKKEIWTVVLLIKENIKHHWLLTKPLYNLDEVFLAFLWNLIWLLLM